MLAPAKYPSWLSIVFSLRGSALVRIRWRLFAVGVVSIALTLLQEIKHFDVPLNLPAFSLMGLALGIFLGFRNNTSYDRFWEGRKLWGLLVNRSRTVARDVLTFVDAADEQTPSDQQRKQIYRTIAFVHSLRMHLRGRMDVEELSPLLGKDESAALDSLVNVPNGILQNLARENEQLRRTGQLSDYRFVALSDHLRALSDIQGGCERIKSTPIPFSYSILIHRVVALYVFTLPFGLVESLHHMTPLVVLLVAYTFLGLDAVGDELEDPFGDDLNDLPLSTLSRMIEVNLRQTLGETDVPELLKPVNGYLP